MPGKTQFEAGGTELKLEFARHALDHITDLIKFLDVKAASATVLATLLATVTILIIDSLYKLASESQSTTLALATSMLFVWFFLHLSQFFWYCRKTQIARTCAVSSEKEFLYPLRILKAYRNDATRDLLARDYVQDVTSASCEDLVNCYALSILTCSSIYETKHDAVNKAMKFLGLSLLPSMALVVVRMVFASSLVTISVFSAGCLCLLIVFAALLMLIAQAV